MSEFIRLPQRRYEDPLSRIWIACAERIGFRVVRTENAYASTDGCGTLLIAVDQMFDPDDSLAQMIFHELCHALVEGEEGEAKEDWGLGYRIDGNPWREHACLRLQAYLADSVGLRGFFAPTTDFRVTFWNSLSADPFYASPESGGRRELSCVAARKAAWRASRPRWTPLRQALESTAAIATATPKSLASDGLPGVPVARDKSEAQVLPSLWAEVEDLPPGHPGGHSYSVHYRSGHGCSDCAWAFNVRKHRHCRHSSGLCLPEDAGACARWEPASELDCQACGACCREAYHSVEVSAREVVSKRHPEMVLVLETHRKLRREGERCAALTGGHTPAEGFACTIYEDRPRTCRDFTLGSRNCLDARQRVGLSL